MSATPAIAMLVGKAVDSDRPVPRRDGDRLTDIGRRIERTGGPAAVRAADT